MDVSWTFFILVFLQCAVYCHTASIGFVAGGDAQRGKPRANLWETIPNVLKKVQPRRKIDQKSIDDTKPSTKYILDENKVLREIKVDHLFIESDIYLGPEAQKNAIIFEAWLWDDGIVPYEIDPNFDSDAIAKINEAIAAYHTHTCLRFVRRTTETDYLYIFPGSGCWSSIGKDGGRQALSLGYGCTFHKTTPMHEFMHAVGFAHEQSRTDRDTYVYIVLENIISGMEHNFNRYEEDYIQDLGSSYDYFSIMHYHDTAFTVNGESTIIPLQSGIRPEDLGSSLDFTETDIYKLNALYNCDGGGGDDGDDGDDGDGGCGAAYLLSNGDSLQITSPNHPSNYGDNVDCTWTVTNADGGNVQLVFNSFQTEAGYDYVQYGSGSTPDADAQRHDGNEIPGSLTSSGDSVWLTFHSDGSQSFSGFQLIASGVDDNDDDDDDDNDECGVNYLVSTGESFEISSPNYPGNYGDNVDCTWAVTNADGGNVHLVFNSFETETGYDYVQYGSGSTPDADAPRHDGSEIPGSLTSSGDSVWIAFHSDGSQSFSGFQLTASGVGDDGDDDDDDDDDNGDNGECGQNFRISAGELIEITSPNYPENYGDNVDCIWTVTNADGGNVQLVFNSFQTETGYDYVQYGSGSTPDAAAPRHDGSEIPGSLTSSGDSVWLTFHSDGSQSFPGFRATASGLDGDEDGNNQIKWREDARCGPNYPLADGSPSECNPDGIYPCCSPHDWCGNTPDHCACPDCIDYRDEEEEEEEEEQEENEGGSGGDSKGCGGVIRFGIEKSNHVTVTSPNYPDNYDNNLNCTWSLTTERNKVIKIAFDFFDTETGYDFVHLGSGRNPTYGGATGFSGSTRPSNFTSTSNTLWLVFTSDGSATKQGFRATAISIADDDGEDANSVKWREDLLCGHKYPLADGSPSQCNPNGKYPCCAPNFKCGNTMKHCSCKGCVDYSILEEEEP